MAACGGGSSSKPPTEVDYCSQRAAKECDGVALNCSVTAIDCQTARVAICSTEVSSIESTQPARPFRPENIGACVSKTAEIYKKSPITPADRAAVAAVCGRVFSGMKKANDVCATSDFECDAGLICDTTLATPRCAAPRTVGATAFCNNPGELCPTGTYCAGAPGARMCTPRLAEGKMCDPVSLPCLESFYCPASTSMCTKKLGVTLACALDSDCAPTAPYCDPFNGMTCDVGFAPSPNAPECASFHPTP
jgi:hypothetical protein